MDLLPGTGTPAERQPERAGCARPRGRDPVAIDGRPGPRREAAIYGKHGVTEYWLVDPIAETVSTHRQRGGVLAPARTFGRKETLRSPLLAGLELRLDDIFSSSP